MKNLLLLSLSLIAFSLTASAQEKKSEKKTSITIVTEENGKKTIIDTTFVNASPEEIDAFFREKGFNDPPHPPVPPAPPVPPSASIPPTPPAPPAPPMHDEDDSYYFRFNMPDFDTAFEFDLDDEMEEVRKALEEARVELRNSLEKSKLSKEEMREIMDDVKKELEQLKIEMEKDGKHKKEFRKKTGYIYKSNEFPLTQSFSYKYSYPHQPFIYSACTGKAPVIAYSNDFERSGVAAYTTVSKQSKARQLLDKIVDKILE